MKVNEQLDGLAAALAGALSHPGFRGQLRAELARSKHHEGSIPFGQLIKGARNGKNEPPGLDRLASRANQARSSLHGRSADQLTDLDLYFPVEAHRKKWRGQADFLVSFTPLTGESLPETLQAFSVKTGKRVSLRTDQPPATPVLVVSKEDHSAAERPQAPAAIEQLPEIEPDFVGQDVEYRPVPQEPGNSYVGLKYLRVQGTKEAWWEGDPEIYVLFGQQRGTGCIGARMSLQEVNRIDTWYNVWNRSPSARWYFDTSFSGRMVLEVWEYDGGYRKLRLSNTSNTGYTCQWSINSGDDYVNRTVLHRDNFNYGRNYWVTMPGFKETPCYGMCIPLIGPAEVSVAWLKVH